MASVSNAEVVNLFKNVYGDITDITPRDQHLSRDIPFSQKQKDGAQYIESAVLSGETGITLANGADASFLNPPRAGTVAQATVTPYVSVLPSVVPWGSVSRSAGGGPVAFIDATKFIVKNNLKTHEKIQEIIRLYGQSQDLLGYVSYYSGTYRGQSFTNGTGTVNNVSFTNGRAAGTGTNGIAVGNWAILFHKGQFAAGHWTGMEGIAVMEVDNSGTVVASGTLVSVYPEFGYIVVNFVPVAAGAAPIPLATPPANSYRLCFQGMEGAAANTYLGVQKVLGTQSGTLFGISTSNFSLWQGSLYNCNNTYLSFDQFQDGVANMVNKSGMEGDLSVYVNPRTWARMNNDQAALRMYDSSYKAQRADNGFGSLTYESQNGTATIKPHRMVKEGESFALYLPVWSRSGSAEVAMSIPGSNIPIIFPLENQMGYAFRSYADQYLFCHAPSQNVYFYGVDDEQA